MAGSRDHTFQYYMENNLFLEGLNLDQNRSNTGNRGRGNGGNRGRGNAGNRGRGNAGYRGRGNAGNRGRGNAGNRGRGNAGNRGRGNAENRGRGNTGNRGRGNGGSRGRSNAGDRGGGNAGHRGRGFGGNRGNFNTRGNVQGPRRAFSVLNISNAAEANDDFHAMAELDGSRDYNRGAKSKQKQRKYIIGYKRLEFFTEMDPDDLVLELVKVKASMNELMKTELKPDWVKLLMKMFAIVTESSLRSNVIDILSMLHGSRLLEILKEQIQMLPIAVESTPVESIEEFIQNIVTVFQEFLELFPSSHSEIPIDNLTSAISRSSLQEISSGVKNQVEQLLDIRDDLLKDKMQQAKKSSRKKINQPNVPPPENFRTLSIVPTVDDIDPDKEPYLRPIKSDGKYEDAEEYLDIQFRLLKEDFVQPLREGIHEIVANFERKDKKQNLKIYRNAKVICPVCTTSGITHLIQFDVSNLKAVPWKHSRRLLFGSLLCLSKDSYETFIFATIANRKPEDLQIGKVEIRFLGGLETAATINPDDVFMMVESPSYYQAYCHVLTAMQHIDEDNVPFQEYIVEGSSHVGLPRYLNNVFNQCVYDLSGCFTRQDIECNVRLAKIENYDGKIELNDSQKTAVEKALTSEFVVIQGPPGTGKTYVGLRIAHALLQNSQYWGEANDVHMLIVCYTNHALDQFLEGLLKMGHESLVRVGGRCQSDILKPYCLSEKMQAARDSSRGTLPANELKPILSAKYAARNERGQIQDELQKAAEQIGKVNNTILNGKIANLSSLLPKRIQSWFVNLNSTCQQVRVSFWEVYLGIYPIPIDMIPEMRRESAILKEEIETEDHKQAEEQMYDDDGIDIEGDAEALLDRWVIDGDIFGHVKNTNNEPESEDDDDQIEGAFVDQQGFQVVVPKKFERRRRAKVCLTRSQPMNEEEVNTIDKPWLLNNDQRWNLYAYLIQKSLLKATDVVVELGQKYEECCERLNELNEREKELYLRASKVIAMTTTGAAQLRKSLNRINPAIVIIEEAAEVLEAHVVTSLTVQTKHVVLIGDHKQLKPKPNVYRLAVKYNLELSLFERMLNNGMDCHSLKIQHRMRPDIAFLLQDIYPELQNHPSVGNYPDIYGVEKNLYFISHNFPEDHNEELKSKCNQHEAQYIAALCWYLLLQGYKPDEITILTMYTGQLLRLKALMPKTNFQGVRIAAVDNFQGEENNIILLSLVRSNTEGKIGFTGIENRICVSLSRAKHGMFVIGDFSFLAERSEYWKRIVNRAEQNNHIGPSLKLYCRNHPESGIDAKMASDFKDAPEGGCKLPCGHRLKCGHACAKACHPVDPEHLDIKCHKTCSKEKCDNGHICKKKCHYGSDCGRCMTKIEKTVPDCNHKQMVPCSVEPEDFCCVFQINVTLPCGHDATIDCHKKNDANKCRSQVDVQLKCGHVERVLCFMQSNTSDIACSEKCTSLLECGHLCSGTCSKCRQGRVHIKCRQDCNRPLTCSHLCKEPCSKECPPCKEKCINFCGHSQCPKPCGEICSPCMENCKWRCKHQRCSLLCHQLCDRPPCNVPCARNLRCGHKCIGLCGEKCPKVCRICNKEEVEEIFFGNEDEEDVRFVQLVDCPHFFEVEGLDHWMNQTNDTDDVATTVELKVCPKCKTPIRRSWRYGNAIKKSMQDVNKVKKEVIKQRKQLSIQQQNQMNLLLDEVKELKEKIPRGIRMFEIVSNILTAIQTKYFALYEDEQQSAWETINENQVTFLESITDIFKELLGDNPKRFKFFEVENFEIAISDLSVINQMSLSSNISVQQMKDADLELFRLSLFFIVYDTKCKAGKTEPRKWNSSYLSSLNNVYDELKSGKLIERGRLKKFKDKINSTRKAAGFGEITKEEKEMIIKAVGLSAGHWYKCKNGHVYAIGECGGAMQESKCPECKETIGGRNHALASGNAHAGEFDNSRSAAWSNMANMNNFDLRDIL